MNNILHYMLETPKVLDTINLVKLLVKILMNVTMDNQQETNKVKTNKTQN